MAPMPPVVVLVVCKTLIAGPPDQNAHYTGWENREWDLTHATMHCRREVIKVFDAEEANGADPQPFSPQRCQRSAMMIGPRWDMQHRSSSYRFFRVACPTPIRSGPSESDPIIGWLNPDCGRVSGVRIECEKDSVI